MIRIYKGFDCFFNLFPLSVSVGCQQPPASILRLSKQPMRLSKPNMVDMLSAPAMNGSFVRKKFAECTAMSKESTDWSIINDAFAPANRGEPDNDEQNLSMEADILRAEDESRIQTRSQNQSQNGFVVPAPPDASRVSTPCQSSTSRHSSSRQSIRCSTPKTFDPNAVNQAFDLFDDLIPPPIAFNNLADSLPESFLTPPNGFGNSHQSDFESSYAPERSSRRIEIDDSSSFQLIEHPELIALLGKESWEYIVMLKLVQLWQKNEQQITVERLLTPRSNRFQAAKTFASLLSKWI